MQSNDFVSMEFCLSETMMMVGDTDLRKGLTRGFYKTCVQRSVEKLAINTFFDVITGDYPLDQQSLQSPLPENCFNIREIYIWNGDDCGRPISTGTVHFKRLFNNKPGGTNYTALRKDGNLDSADSDPIFYPFMLSAAAGNATLYYASIQNGLLMFSSSYRGFLHYRIVYNGMGGKIDEAPIIPRILSEVVIDMSAERALRALKAREPRIYRTTWADTRESIYNMQTGSYWDAIKRIASMDNWMRDCYRTYQSRGNW